MLNPVPKPVKKPKERKPLRRKRRMRAKASRRVLEQSEADKRYLEAVRLLPCCAPHPLTVLIASTPAVDRLLAAQMHGGGIHAHHAGARPGVGMKAKDDTAIPLCDKHHRHWHDAKGVFAGWTKQQRRYWADAAISDTRRIIAETTGQLIGEERRDP